jgi:predicted transcriptional regulator
MSNERYAFVMMVRSTWWQRFRQQHHDGKQVQSYVRTGKTSPRKASKLFFYLVKPIGEIVGHADFIERKVGDPQELWKEHGLESVLSTVQQYKNVVKCKSEASFIRFENLYEAERPIALNSLLMLLGTSRLQRKGFYVNRETAEKLIDLMKR